MSKQALEIPFAYDETGELVRPADGLDNKQYYCPACGEALILRRGKIKRPHFAHYGNSPCARESILHSAAKAELQRRIQDWLDNKGDRPYFKRDCILCLSKKVRQGIPETISGVDTERRLPSGHQPDVVLLRDEADLPTIVAGIEVVVTHEVDEQKAKELEVPWLEVEAKDILSNPLLMPVRRDNLDQSHCNGCRKDLPILRDKVDQLLNRWDIEWPQSHYTLGITECFRCKKQIPVFAWEAEMWSSEPPPSPKPRTVKHRFSKEARDKYWTNTCPGCGVLQGDFYLHGPGGPFGPTYERDTMLLRRAQALGIF